MTPAEPTGADAPPPAGMDRVVRLHLSTGTENDVHLLDNADRCTLHQPCPAAALQDSPVGARVIVARRDGVRISGLEGSLSRDEACFVLGDPVTPAEVDGLATALSFDAPLYPLPQTDSTSRIARVENRKLSAFLAVLVRQVTLSLPRTPQSSTRMMARAILSVLISIHVEEMARASLRITRDRTDDLYWKAVRTIRERIADPELSPAAVAQACAVSPRYLHTLFERRGETVSKLIRHERLERCRAMLADPTTAEVSISEIASRWGFSTASHFSQSFRGAYGLTPREWREENLKKPERDT